MDNSVGIKTTDLSKYIDKLDASGKYPYLEIQYKEQGTTYYSVVAQACDAYFVEILSENAPSRHDTTHYKVVEEPRVHIDEDVWGPFDASSGDSVFKVSRATTKIDEMVSFYTETIGGSVTKRGVTTKGVEYAIVKLDHADAQLHFIKRDAPKGAEFTVEDFETTINTIHDRYVKSVNCGFD